MKRIESVKLSGINGERVDVVTFARWKKQIAGLEFSFALHLLPSFKVGFPNKLWISELGTGFNTLVVIKHPVSGQHMTDTMAEKFGQSFVVKLAKSALHNTLKRYGDSAFVDGLVRAEMLLAKQQRQKEVSKVNCEVCEDTGVQAELGADGGLLAVACKACGGVEAKDTGKVTHSIRDFANVEGVRCETCLDSKAVCTTEKDHEGQPIEAECPVCVTKSAGIAEPARANVKMEYVKCPVGDEWDKMCLDTLHERRSRLQERADQHGTMTGDTSEGEYSEICEEIDDLNEQIHDLENPPCSK